MHKTMTVFLPDDGKASSSSSINFKFGLLSNRPHYATREHLFLYPQEERARSGKAKMDKHQH